MSDNDEFEVDAVDTDIATSGDVTNEDINTAINSGVANDDVDTSTAAKQSRRKSSAPVKRKNGVYTRTMVKKALSTNVEAQKRRKYRFRSGTVALREIRKYQTTTNTLIDRAPFIRLVREITEEIRPGLRWQKKGMQALQESVESMLTDLFSDANTYTLLARRETLFPQDILAALHSRYGDHPTMDFKSLLVRQLQKKKNGKA